METVTKGRSLCRFYDPLSTRLAFGVSKAQLLSRTQGSRPPQSVVSEAVGVDDVAMTAAEGFRPMAFPTLSDQPLSNAEHPGILSDTMTRPSLNPVHKLIHAPDSTGTSHQTHGASRP